MSREERSVFAVVRVWQDYDHVEEVEWVASFRSLAEAEAYIRERKEEQTRSWRDLAKYVDAYVASLEIPHFGTPAWEKLVKPVRECTGVTPQNVRDVLRRRLPHVDESLHPPDFKPPETVSAYNLFVMDMKLPEKPPHRQETENPVPVRKEWICGYYACTSLENRCGVGRFLAASEYEARGMMLAFLARHYPAGKGWTVSVTAAERDALVIIADPEKAELTPTVRVPVVKL